MLLSMLRISLLYSSFSLNVFITVALNGYVMSSSILLSGASFSPGSHVTFIGCAPFCVSDSDEYLQPEYYIESSLLGHWIWRLIISIWPLSIMWILIARQGAVWILCCMFTIFPLEPSKCAKSLPLSLLPVSAFVEHVCLNQFLLFWLPNDNFPALPLPLYMSLCILFQGRTSSSQLSIHLSIHSSSVWTHRFLLF